jgi:hypothetical protein
MFPTTEAALRDYGVNFSTILTLAPVTYGLVAGDAVQVAAANAAYLAAYLAATTPATRTAATIDTKNTTKIILISVLRGYGAMIKSNLSVSDADKINIGVGTYDRDPTPIPAPASFPLVNILSARRPGSSASTT